jgi:hypothetical protein
MEGAGDQFLAGAALTHDRIKPDDAGARHSKRLSQASGALQALAHAETVRHLLRRVELELQGADISDMR